MKNLSVAEAKKILAEEQKKYDGYKSMKLNLDMSRGKPSKAQLDLSLGLLDVITAKNTDFGTPDVRNYGLLDGTAEAKALFSSFCEVATDEIMVLGNASLNIMYDTLQRAMQFGVLGGLPFNKQDKKLKWLCPSPGYDRHFAVTELFGFEMITVPMNEDGPDMDVVEKLVGEDDAIKGIWCVPKYSNPQGIVYSDEVVKRFANLKPKAKDFRIYWDNAYMVHFTDKDVPLLNLLNEAKSVGNGDIVYMFGSTSKITFAGAGVAFMCASKANLDSLKKLMSIQTIGPDKLNQTAHVRYFKDKEGIYEHMKKHAALMTPKFEAVDKILREELSEYVNWITPHGGYFISCDLPEFTASRAISLAKEAGVIFTPAGSTYPLKKDPKDSNIRIAPSLPPIAELVQAMYVFASCVKIAYCEKILG